MVGLVGIIVLSHRLLNEVNLDVNIIIVKFLMWYYNALEILDHGFGLVIHSFILLVLGLFASKILSHTKYFEG